MTAPVRVRCRRRKRADPRMRWPSGPASRVTTISAEVLSVTESVPSSASGVVRDLRKDEPYLTYPDFDFQVPYATELILKNYQ